MLRILFIIVSCSALVFTSGCGAYQLRGKVIEGFENAVLVVPADDPRLEEDGVRDVRIRIYRDPGRLSRELIATDSSMPDGTFSIELPAFGAGWMDEQWLIETQRSDYRNTSETVRLPASTKRSRVLIMVAPGRSTPIQERDNLWDEYERYR